MPLYRLSNELQFPPAELATRDGLLAVGGDLSTARLLLAYREGIFPWYSDGEPILWWSPDPRMVLFPGEFHSSRSLNRTLLSHRYTVTADRAFRDVVSACAATGAPPRDSTWITKAMRHAYASLHDEGFAHSFETWQGDELAGGLYGVSLGACFFGESMFAKAPDASKVALHALVAFARSHAFTLIDCQVPNDHLRSLGAREIRRSEFLQLLAESNSAPTLRGSWTAMAESRGLFEQP